MAISSIVLLIGAVLIALKLGNKIANPIYELSDIAESLSVGNTDIPKIDCHQKKYIGALSNLACSLSHLLSNNITQASAFKALANGDLTKEYTPLSNKDTVGNSIIEMTHNLNEMIKGIQNSSLKVSAVSSEIAAANNSLAQGSVEQSQSISAFSESLSNIAKGSENSLEKANYAQQIINDVVIAAQNNVDQMNSLQNSVNDISNASSQIANVIKIIDDIAFQTNILALNASVEAARAGQHGKGFAVVADEVRNLAAKSAEAASGTEQLIINSVNISKQGKELAKSTATSLQEILSKLNDSTAIVQEITQASKETTSNLEKINLEVETINKVVQQNTASSQQSAAASEDMSSQAEKLNALVDNFNIIND